MSDGWKITKRSPGGGIVTEVRCYRERGEDGKYRITGVMRTRRVKKG